MKAVLQNKRIAPINRVGVTTGYLYFQDSLGNTSHVTNPAGNLLERYTYSAFGQPSFFNSTSQPLNSSTYNIKHLFQGQLWTQETGLNDYRNRVELPTMGVFLQPDPIGFKGDAANVYRFCGNNAVNRTDPMGLFDRPAVFLGYAPDQGLQGPGRDLAQRLGASNIKDLVDKLLSLFKPSQKPAQQNQPTKLTRKLEPVFSVDTYDKDTGTIWIHRRWEYTLTNQSGPVIGVRVHENIDMTNKIDYKDFPREKGGHSTDRYGRVYDDWKVGFSSKNGSVMITQGLFTSGSTTTALHSVTIGASNGGWHQFNNPKDEKDPIDFK